MERSNESMAWYNALPKKKQRLLDKWEKMGLTWVCGSVWDENPHSVELEGYTDAGEDMLVDLEDVSIEALREYVENFDITEEVAIWWEDGKPGRGVPFDHQGEQVEDYEQWLAQIEDIIARSSGQARKRDLTNEQQLYVERFKAAAKDLRAIGVGVRYSRKSDCFKFYRKAA